MSELLELGRGGVASQTFSVHLGAELARLEEGEAEIALPIEPHLGQQNGFVHGGVLAYLVDMALTFAGGTVLGPNVLTQEYKVSLVRPATGDRLVARGTVRTSSRRQAIVACDVFAVHADAEALCATSLGTIRATDDGAAAS